MRIVETKNGSRAAWTPGIRNPRFASVAGSCLFSAAVLDFEVLVRVHGLPGEILAVVIAIWVLTVPAFTAWTGRVFVTRDFVFKGSPRRPTHKVRRSDVALVRRRGELGEFIGQHGTVLLTASAFLTPVQIREMAQQLHVPFSANPEA